METRLRLLLLTALAAVAGCATTGDATVPAAEPPAGTGSPTVVVPQVERRQVRVADVAAEDWEVGWTFGALSVEDFEVNAVYGARFAYHISEDFFAEGLIGSSDVGISSYERHSGSGRLLSEADRQFLYYSLGFGWNVLPGEVFFGGKRAYNSAIYLTAGAGSTKFAGDDRFTVTLGAGARILLNDTLAAHLDLRDHILDVDVFGANKQTHNLEATFSLTGYF
jgi:outer membrane beta-barrel protein